MALSTSGAAAPLAIARLAAAVDASDPANFPPRSVQVPRDGLRNGIGIPGLVVGGAGLAGIGASLVRAMGSGGSMRVHMPTMIALGAAAAIGGGVFGLSRLIGPATEPALAAGIPTKDLAKLVDAQVSGRTKIVECEDGTFAILRDNSPVYSGGGGGSSSSSGSSGSRPSSGSSGGSYSPSYPSSGSSGSTSRGDDSGSSRDSTSNGNPSYDDF